MKKTSLAFLVLMVVAFSACKQTSEPENEEGNLVYRSTFEKESDIVGWSGISKENLSDTTYSGGDKHSLHIGGGCIQPAASYESSSVQPGKFKLSFWARMRQSSQSAAIYLGPSDYYSKPERLRLDVADTTWKYYETEKSLNISSPTKLKLEVLVGGIIFADVYIDNLKIGKIN
jgi:hypothetical protein